MLEKNSELKLTIHLTCRMQIFCFLYLQFPSVLLCYRCRQNPFGEIYMFSFKDCIYQTLFFVEQNNGDFNPFFHSFLTI